MYFIEISPAICLQYTNDVLWHQHFSMLSNIDATDPFYIGQAAVPRKYFKRRSPKRRRDWLRRVAPMKERAEQNGKLPELKFDFPP
jgi:hypothetical protein